MSIAVDLDGTLAEYEKFKGEEIIGKIIPIMKKRVEDWISSGKQVVIFSARAGTETGKKAIEKWLIQNGLPGLRITNIKDTKMEVFFDDRAVQVERNTGKILSPSNSWSS